MASGERLRSAAAKNDLVDPVAGSPRFLRVGKDDAARAARA